MLILKKLFKSLLELLQSLLNPQKEQPQLILLPY